MRRLALAALLLAALPAGCSVNRAPAVRVVPIRIHHSRYEPERVKVSPGERVRFAVTNTDPIDHEFILGGPGVQAKHEVGTETHHGTIPGELSVPAGASVSTSFMFGDKGRVVFACHLPGHFAFGMRGEVIVG